MIIPAFMDRDDYLQNPIMRRFLRDHNIDLVNSRADYIKAIEDYSNRSDAAQEETINWLTQIVKEGSKEICYRKIHGITDVHRDPVLLRAKINELYPGCPHQKLFSYSNTSDRTLIDYDVITNSHNEVVKIEFTFSKLFLYGETGKLGDATVFPVFIEIYLDQGFILSRAKAKSTLYQYSETNQVLLSEYKIDTRAYAMSIVDEIVATLGFQTSTNPQIVKNEISQMLYRIYEKYSFTPKQVIEDIASQSDLIKEFVNQIFSNLNLDPRNKEKALLDAQIFVEKFISINGDNEDTFKNGRDAYLIKVTADDEIELTKIDTTSAKTVPLQCTEAFFDSKKSVIKSKKCKRLNLIFKRTNDIYFSNNPLVVQLGAHKDHGYIKTVQYAEEADIQNVLQAIFENY